MMRTLFIVIVLTIVAAAYGCSERSPVLLPGVASFLEAHTEFGQAVAAEPVPDWARGERQRVRFDSGRVLVFYTIDGKVLTVYEHRPGGGRVKIWGEYAQLPDTPHDLGRRSPQGTLPAYTVLNIVDMYNGGRAADILISAFSQQTPESERESTLRAIMQKENYSWVTLYCSEKAYKADTSAADYPDALETCYLGQIRKGVFTSGGAVY